MADTIFITGATGNIGGKLVIRILEDDPSARLILLVRGKSTVEAEQRVEKVLGILSPETNLQENRKRIRVVCGDITVKGLGLSESVLDSLASEVTHIIHSAAATQFTLSLECTRQINFTGTRNVMEFAARVNKAGNLKRIAHISTAFVCGDRDGVILEDELCQGQKFSNSYEQSKWETETMVRELMSELPIAIFRPSIVVGDSVTGRTIAFNVLYTPLRFICRGDIKALPCSADTPLDVIPLDYAADAIHHIFLKTANCVGKTYNIVAGKEAAVTIGEIVRRAVRYVDFASAGQAVGQPGFVSPGLFSAASRFLHGKAKKILRLLQIYTPYISIKRVFDNRNTVQALQGTCISPPKLTGYLNVILSHCLETEWGKQNRQAA